jgi:hypothetical protein
MAMLTKVVHELCSDEPTAANYHDLHVLNHNLLNVVFIKHVRRPAAEYAMAVAQGLGKDQVDLAIRARDRQRTNSLDHVDGR